MSQYQPYLGNQSKTPGVYDNREGNHRLAGSKSRTWYCYVVVQHNGVHQGHHSRTEARAAWKVEKQRAKDSPPPRKPSTRIPTTGTAPRAMAPGVTATPRARRQRRRPVNPGTSAVRREEFENVAKHIGQTKGSCRDAKHVCSRCGWIIRTSCRLRPPGTIRHQTRWDKETGKFVPCGGTFIIVE